ncbi:DUF4350 domain-containing protein [Planktosalinus lacus]|uniref:DUF4350 domain-containing protein n=1 Tax=Planktosalinus lacus TaxID=1526573 RepID=A0A8J2VBB8_9FLAO|nr:DUF4350 domain-containing protein [Planktosalinus lacus]GGD98477.1 hypothetical protein GCM10011312_22480 [Planktosalinus lacus]
MGKPQKLLFTVLLILLGFLVYLEATKPLPVSWFPSYSKEDKIPLGTYILHENLKSKFSESFIEVNEPPFQFINSNPETQGTYVFINNTVIFDEEEAKELFAWTAKGNTLFLASKNYSNFLLDTLNLEINNIYLFDKFETQPLLTLVNKHLNPDKSFHINKSFTIPYFEEIDTSSQVVLGFSQAFEKEIKKESRKVNFLKIPFGEGELYLYNQPEIFTNFFLLEQENHIFTENVLSYINNESTIYWDNYYKTGKRINTSPLKVIFNNKSLKWAYYLILFGALLYILFEGKRKQRVIPVINPIKNKTLEYTQTIAGIYFDKKDNKAILNKLIRQLFDYVRVQLRLETNEADSRFIEELAIKTNTPKEEIKSLLNELRQLQNKEQITDKELISFHEKITQLKINRDGKP